MSSEINRTYNDNTVIYFRFQTMALNNKKSRGEKKKKRGGEDDMIKDKINIFLQILLTS